MKVLVDTTIKIGTVISVESDSVKIQADVNYKNMLRPGWFINVLGEDNKVVCFVTSVLKEGAEIFISAQPIGQIVEGYFVRGVRLFPTIGDEVFPVSDGDIAKILNILDDESTIALGKFGLNENYKINVCGKSFFSKHLAILGNSGAGKSWCVAKIISEMLKFPSAQMVLFDLHGEYKSAFEDESYQLPENVLYLDQNDLVVPYWLLSFREIETLFVDKSNPQTIAAQTSLLKQGITKLKKPSAKKLGLLANLSVDTPIYFSLSQLKVYAENMNDARFVLNTNRYAFSKSALRNLPPDEQEQIIISRRVQFNQGEAEGEIPHGLYFHRLTGLIDKIEQKLNDSRYDFLLRPIEHGRKSKVFSSFFPQIAEDADDWSKMIIWVIRLITGNVTPRKNLVIVDLSGIPSEIIDIVVGLLTNLIFNFNFFTPKEYRQPIILFYEEAHNYIPRDLTVGENFAKIALERVAKEGRKYGVCSAIVSQRPRELSETVLSQCGNMIIMRITNPDDQEYVGKVVSDQFVGFLNVLATLGPGEGFVIGDSVPIPLRIIIDPPVYKPSSENANFLPEEDNKVSEGICDKVVEMWLKGKRK